MTTRCKPTRRALLASAAAFPLLTLLKWPASADGAFPDIRVERSASQISEDVQVVKFLIRHGHGNHGDEKCERFDDGYDALLILNQESKQKESTEGGPEKSYLIDDRARIQPVQKDGGYSPKNRPI